MQCFFSGRESQRSDTPAGRGDLRVQLPRGRGGGLQGGGGPPLGPAPHVHQRARHRAGLRVAGTEQIQSALVVVGVHIYTG